MKRCFLATFANISGYPQIVQKFETEFSNYIGKKYGLTFCNGTSSIEAAIYALNLHKEDQILTTSSNFHASIGPIKNLGHKIVFVDIDKNAVKLTKEKPLVLTSCVLNFARRAPWFSWFWNRFLLRKQRCAMAPAKRATIYEWVVVSQSAAEVNLYDA